MSTDSKGVDLPQGGMVSCRACEKEIHSSAAMCPNCGLLRRSSRYKNKFVAAFFAFFLGAFGAHRFYLGQWWGVFYLLFFWLWLPGLVAFVEFIYFLVCDSKKWDEKYNEGMPAGPNERISGGLIAVLMVFSMFFLVFMIGILAAIALPAYHDYTVRAKLAESHNTARVVMQGVELYVNEHRQWPSTLTDIELNADIETPLVELVIVRPEVVYVQPSQAVGVEGAIIYVASESEAGILWSCKESTVKPQYLPPECRP